MNLQKIRGQIPILSKKINGRPLVYFDNAATAPKPRSVIRAETDFYENTNANIHRGIHTLSERATQQYEAAREKVRRFLNAQFTDEIVFTSGATEGLNFLAYALGEKYLRRGDEVLLSEMEHHSNIVPWQILGKKYGWRIKYAPISSDGRLDLVAFKKFLTRKTKLVSITGASNVTGAVNPIKKIAVLTHKSGALLIVDAAQSAAHLPINVRDLNCDFLVFSGHKLFGPTGVGVLYGRKTLLEDLAPYKFGGQMIESVSKERTVFAALPYKFEAGTMPIAQVIGLGAAIEFLEHIGWKKLRSMEERLTAYALKKLKKVPGLKLLGPAPSRDRLPVFSFTFAGIHPHDIATLLDARGIAVRSGHHCAQILHQAMNVTASTRASLAFFNTTQEVDRLIEALEEIRNIFEKRT